MSQRSSTIKDVAGLAGVSTATVSNILRGKGGVYASPTVRRVREAARSLNYSPNTIARSLVRRRTHMIGVVFQKGRDKVLTQNLYYAQLLDGILEQAGDQKYQTTILSLPTGASNDIVDYVQSGFVEGLVLFTPTNTSPLLSWAQQSRFPMVAVGSTFPATLGMACVDVDNFSAIYETVRWLVEEGHRRVGSLSGDAGQMSTRLRKEAYEAALRDSDLVPAADWQHQGEYTAESGHEGALRLLDVRPALTAIICGNDWIALGALQALRGRGVRVPQDVSLVGFDDIEPARLADPPLTTIRQPVRDIGSKAAQILIHQLETGEVAGGTTLFPGTLVERQSVAQI